MRIRSALALILLPCLTWLFQQTSTAQSTFTSVVRGRVTDDLTHEGVSTVRVTLTGGGMKDPVVVTSDAGGNVLFPGLVQGRYNLDIEKAGYFPQSFPDIVVDGAGTGDAEVKVGDLNIQAQRSISGTLKWDDDEPVTNAVIHVMTFRGAGVSRAPFVATVNSNERGEFKIQGLRARRYMVFAYQRPQVVEPGTALRVALPVFYPGTNSAERAHVFDMRTTKDVTGLSLTMKEERGVSIEGVVTAESLPAGSPVQLGLTIPGVPAPFLVSAQTQVGNAFRLYPVPPGSYLLFVQGTPGLAIPAGINPATITPEQAAALRASAAPAEPGITAIPVVVNRGTSIGDLRISIPAPSPIVGKVEVDDAQRGQPSRISPAVNVIAAFEWLPKMELQYGIIGNATNQNGELRVLGAVKGQTYIPGPGSNWGPNYVASYKQGTKDLAAGGLPVIAGGDPVHILLKRDFGRLEGRVKDGDRSPWRAFVVAAPRDRRIESWFRRVFTMSDGSFRLDNLAPGEYDVYAFDQADEEIFYTPEFLRRYAAGSKPITVAPYSSQSLELALTKTER